MLEKKLSTYTHQINLRKTLSLFLLPTALSLYSLTHKLLYYKLNKLGLLIIRTTSQTIKNLTSISKHTNNVTTSQAGIYSIPCKNSDKHYIGQTQHHLEKRIYEYKQSIKLNDD